jgi:DNA polymerase-3 subunit delta
MKELNKAIQADDIKPLYLFYGSERFLLQRTLELLTSHVAPGDSPFNLERLNAENLSIGELLSRANTLPFFTARKLIIVDNCPWFANKKKDSGEQEEEKPAPDFDELLKYLQNPSETTVLVFIGDESVNKAKKLTKAVAKCGVVQEFSALKGNAAVLWLDELLHEKRCKMSASAKQQLLLNCDYNCTLINNELEKLSIYAADEPEISQQDVKNIVSSNTTASIFNLVDYVADGNLAQSMRALEQVVLNDKPESIIPRLADHFETVYIVKVMQQQGYTTKEIMAATGKSFPFMINKAGQQAAKYSEQRLQKALETLLTADKKFKSGVSDVMDAIETAIIQICLLSK